MEFAVTWRQGAFLLFCVCLSQLLVYLVGKRLPYSAYYVRDDDEISRRLSKLLSSSSQSYTDAVEWKNSSYPKNLLFNEERAKKLCVGIVEHPDGYIEETLGSLISGTTINLQSDMKIVTLKGFGNQKSKLDSLFKGMDLTLDKSQVERFPNIKRLLEHVAALKTLYKMGCQNALVLEDQVIASDNWSEKVMKLVEGMEKDDSWLMVRLVSNFSKIGFTLLDVPFLLGLSAVFVVIVWLTTVGIFYLIDKLSKGKSLLVIQTFNDLQTPILGVFLILLGGNFIVCLILMGKPTFYLQAHRIHKVDTGQLGIANLYNGARMLDLAEYLEEEYHKAGHNESLTDLPGLDEHYYNLSKQLEKYTGRRYKIGSIVPSIFQNAGTKEAKQESLSSIPISHDFPDMEKSIEFTTSKFL